MISALVRSIRGVRIRSGSAALHAFARGEIGHARKRVDELRAAVRVAGVIDGIHADEDVVRLQDFGPGQRKSEEDGIARRARR